MIKYKIADAHAHIYPSKIAEKATEAVGNFYDITMDELGTVEKLKTSGDKIGVDKYLVCSVATTAAQVDAINRFIADACRANSAFVGLGAYHQDVSAIAETLENTKALGLRGIKLHPDFQKFNIDDPKMFPVYEKLIELDLCVLYHIGDNRYDFSSPERLARVMDKYPDLKSLAAHFGGYRCWSNGIKALKGANVIYDTSSSLMFIRPDEAKDMIHEIGAEHFFFGTDFPMWTHEDELKRFLSIGLSEEENKKILYDNFAQYFGLEE